MAPATVKARVSGIRDKIRDDGHVTLTDFARGKGWRVKLSDYDIVELREHGERTAWIVSEDGMEGIVDYISDLEAQLERASIEAMIDSRRGLDNWASGKELAEGAARYFKEHEKALLAELSR